MVKRLPRLLLAFSALLLAVGGLMHARAFDKTLAAIAAAGAALPPFYAGSFKVLWLSDSATLIILALVFAWIAARPVVAARSVVVLLALVPAATSALLYTFLGSFIPAHLLLVAAGSAVAGGLRWRPDH
jgi:hypothetical protein